MTEFPDLEDVDGELGILIRGDYAAVKAKGERQIKLLNSHPNFTPSDSDSTMEEGEVKELVGHMSVDDVGFCNWDD